MRIWFASKGIALDNRARSRSWPGPVRGLRRPLVALVALTAVGVLAAGCGSNSSGSGDRVRAAMARAAPPPRPAVRGGHGHRGQHQAGDGPGRRQRPDPVSVREGPAEPVGLQRRLCRGLADRSEQRHPHRGGGVKASLLGTISRGDGTTQVAYNGHPLYYYAGDSGAGQLNGQGIDAFGAKWFVVTPAGGADTGA